MNLIKRVKRQLQASLGTKPSPIRTGTRQPFIFIHINKTGGTSVGNAIGLTLKNHQTAKEIIQRVGQQQWDATYKFTFVRNPWDRIVSLYKYRHKKNKTQIASLDLGFEQWINKTIGPEQDPLFYDNPKSFQSQADWLKDLQGHISINCIGRFERINEDFNAISTAIGLEVQLPHLNASRHELYQTYYNNRTKEIVSHWFCEDIEQFKYRFKAQ